MALNFKGLSHGLIISVCFCAVMVSLNLSINTQFLRSCHRSRSACMKAKNSVYGYV
ncbi:UNVERIFIED_CONTAM: hypothetical protein GTU68_055559 [Idotea baltica]|nr:hypothetical protein [Idotea baltica]